MIIDLVNLKNKEVILDSNLEIGEEYFLSSPILKMKNAYISGRVYQNFSDIIVINAVITGVMVLKDTLTLEEIDKAFTLEIDETISENSEYLQKNQNTLDIMGILWQNIVLEVPIRYTKSSDVSLKGEGWELINQEAEEEGENKDGSSI